MIVEDGSDTIRLRATMTLRNDKMLAARERLGLSQKALATLSCTPLSTICDMERLRYTGFQTWERARRVADVLELRPEDVVPPSMLGLEIESRRETVREVSSGLLLGEYPEVRALSHRYAGVDAEALARDQREAIRSAMEGLTSREQAVLSLRFGLDGGTPKTLEETARMFCVTRERVRQLEIKAVRKMRVPFRLNKLRDVFE